MAGECLNRCFYYRCGPFSCVQAYRWRCSLSPANSQAGLSQ
ncbi:MAG: hypothetical protein P8176_08855 [Gammaproteobacteria bacterium]